MSEQAWRIVHCAHLSRGRLLSLRAVTFMECSLLGHTCIEVRHIWQAPWLGKMLCRKRCTPTVLTQMLVMLPPHAQRPVLPEHPSQQRCRLRSPGI